MILHMQEHFSQLKLAKRDVKKHFHAIVLRSCIVVVFFEKIATLANALFRTMFQLSLLRRVAKVDIQTMDLDDVDQDSRVLKLNVSIFQELVFLVVNQLVTNALIVLVLQLISVAIA